MFFFTLRKGGLKKLAVIAVCGAVLAGSVVGVSAIIKSSHANKEVSADMINNIKISGIADVTAFLSGYGVMADPASGEVITVKIPRKWDDSFRAFNEVIRESGLDLSKHKGKKVDKWVVSAPALCTEAEKVSAVVLVYKGKAIGAYLIAKPSGEVSAIKSPAIVPGAPLTSSEKAANAAFGTAAETVNDSSEIPVAAESAMPTE